MNETSVFTRAPDIRVKGIVVVWPTTVQPYLYSISADANRAIATNRREVRGVITDQ